jgi:hypothetical protein
MTTAKIASPAKKRSLTSPSFAYTAKTDNASATKDKKADLASAVKDFTGSIVAHPDSEKSYLNRGGGLSPAD